MGHVYESDITLTPSIKLLSSFLTKFAKDLNEKCPSLFLSDNKFSFNNLNNMQLVVGGSRFLNFDPIKDAFSILILIAEISYP